MILVKSTDNKSKSLLALSRHPNRAVTYGFNYLTENSKNPLVIAFGSTEPFSEVEVSVARITDVSSTALSEDLKELKSTIAKGNFDGVMVDSMTLLRRLMIAEVAGDGQPTIQEYGIINNRIANFIIPLRHATNIFVSTAAFVLDDEKSKKANKEVWEHDLTANLRATLIPQFDFVHYIAYNSTTGEEVQEDRDLAIDGSFPRNTSIPKVPSRKAKK